MKRTAGVLAAAAIVGLAATSGSALADGARSGWGLWYGSYGDGPAYYGEHALPAYDSYAFAYEYPVYTGSNVTAIAVDLVNSRFRHRRVVGPGVVYHRGEYPRPYRINPYW
ncbi:hypothetical protein [Bradyrhizobium sp. Cp5.3]|uniref:hypothetical protein n=1 Tax=Bradyrhizobium sp. Cp5.3 TaxID=443598 RepID=UPI0012EBBEF6|nr:hypothetical protein [Bradyrhizobium sp. Cp5.3]